MLTVHWGDSIWAQLLTPVVTVAPVTRTSYGLGCLLHVLLVSLQDFARRATAVCGKDVSELSKVASGLQEAHAPYFCLDLAFCYTVLTQGFDLPENTEVTLVKQVSGLALFSRHWQNY